MVLQAIIIGVGRPVLFFWVDKKEKLAAVFMTQVLAGPPNLGDRYRTLVYQAIDD